MSVLGQKRTLPKIISARPSGRSRTKVEAASRCAAPQRFLRHRRLRTTVLGSLFLTESEPAQFLRVAWRSPRRVVGFLAVKIASTRTWRLACTQNTLDVSNFPPSLYHAAAAGIAADHFLSTCRGFSKNPLKQPRRKAPTRSFF